VNVVVAAGGTGGHIFAALALADALARDHGAEVRFIGTPDGQEASLVPAAGYRFDAVPSMPLYREVSLRAAKAPAVALRSALACARLVEGADVAVGTGGYVSVPAILAARREHVPIVLHEPNARPGLANRILARFASAIGVVFEDVGNRLRGPARVEVIGYPVREAILRVADHRTELAEEAREVLGLEQDRLTLLVWGGSQGALHLDEIAAAAIPRLGSDEHLQLIVLTGPSNLGVVAPAAERATGVRVRALPFLDRMELAFAIADLAVSRAGATTIAEQTVCGLPAVLIPYPHATENHQEANARELERVGAANVVLDAHLSPQVFIDRVHAMLDDTAGLASMAARSLAWAKPDAVDRFARLVAEVAKR
jgi:UDP-N-acetylglucosamine--N-acetylmuramyl-(pentapeptide) pyrophosphoryl-undecaprenol N-acetylglucosamine transferase